MLGGMTARHRSPTLAVGRAAALALRGGVAGEVYTSPLHRWLYSTDSSGYRVVPDGSRGAARLTTSSPRRRRRRVRRAARRRGAGTSLAGQAVGPGLAVDCFHLDRVLDIDPEARLARVRPGVIQASLNAPRRPSGSSSDPTPPPSTRRPSAAWWPTTPRVRAPSSTANRTRCSGSGRAGRRRVVEFGACAATISPAAYGSRPAAKRLAAELARCASAAAGDRRRLPQTRRYTSGYKLRQLLAPRPNLGKLLAGSEGTLALFLELEVLLDARPARRWARR